MSLKQFLVVGRSFVGLSGDKSPYELRRENRLPVFQPSPRFVGSRKGEAELVQSDWVEQQEQKRKEALERLERANASYAQPIAVTKEPANPKSKRKRNWLRIFSFGLLGRAKEQRPLQQSELSLDRINVVRNDLADSDLELVIKKKKKA